MRAEVRLKKVFKRIIFGESIDPKMISTSYIERQAPCKLSSKK